MTERVSTIANLSRQAQAGPSSRFDRWCLERVAAALGQTPVRLALWDGAEVRVGDAEPPARVVFRTRAALLRVLWNPDLYFGEAYENGSLAVDGDLVRLLEGLYRATAARVRPRRAPAGHGRWRARTNVRRHYDLGNEFYGLWLDEQLVYTCAYYPQPDVSLEAAQRAKLELVCRKLALEPGERVVEAGCGWGALALHMARHYGVHVRAYNLSREQVRYARARAQQEGLGGRVEFVEDDYRSIQGTYDAFVSVGMLEHVGPGRYRALGALVDRCLDERRGRGLLHFIGQDRPEPLNAWIRRRIFPGAYPPTLAEAVAGVLGAARVSVVDVENLRLHYARTLEDWRRRLLAAATDVEGRFGAPFLRRWRLYLSGSEAAFRAGALQLFQVSFARRDWSGVPWTRAGLYAGGWR
jgi:cyclopropane-fatty-acyl-phospholipid synthase